ncbi:uncharacterized protein LOC131242627 [Magnolia sinica]|uniref:uncharacterized protein LOC131242627 n=1 Tax=Magnolia sinica TaxID=86752 RepID=UPI002658FB83|nr:uncharacterized protein LOC131242627 [Magnolia sinica]
MMKRLERVRTSLLSSLSSTTQTANGSGAPCSSSSSLIMAGPIPSLNRPTPAITQKCLLENGSNGYRNMHYFSRDPFFHHSLVVRFSSTTTTTTTSDEEEISDEGWEDEEDEETEPQIGDGGDGGGVVLRGVPWGQRTLSEAQEVLHLHFSNDMSLFSFKTSPRGYIYVRLDKLSNMYGCPSMEEIENFSSLYKKRLDEIGECGEIPLDLALEVSSPGAERILKVPDDLDRFKDMPMHVQYMEEDNTTESNNNNNRSYRRQQLEMEGVFLLDSIETESGYCVWKLADVKENRDASAKGRLLSRKQKDWRLRLPFQLLRRVTLYLEF